MAISVYCRNVFVVDIASDGGLAWDAHIVSDDDAISDDGAGDAGDDEVDNEDWETGGDK